MSSRTKYITHGDISKRITIDGRDRRDRQEQLNNCNCCFTRCCGGHLTPKGYVCQNCDSNEPSTICFKEKVRTAEERPRDYTDPKVARLVHSFPVLK